MIKRLLLLQLLSCSGDISIITVDKDNAEDTSDTLILDTASCFDPVETMTDLTIGMAQIHFRQIACPACVGASGEFDIQAELLLHYPTSGNYFDHLTPLGTCTTNLYDTHVSAQPLLATQSVSFNNIQLNPVGQGEWKNPYLYEYQYQRQTPYTITTEHGSIYDAFVTVEGFDWIEPYTLLWVDPSYAFEAPISKNGTTFTWSPAISNAQFEILIAVYSADGSQFLGAVSCLENDDGYMFVPGSYFQSFPTWSLAAIHLIRHRIAETPATEFDGWLQSHMLWEVVGTGHIE
jgi:hypothetical protein